MAVATPGQLGDLENNVIETYVASEVIQPGVMCQLAADGVSARQCQGTRTDTTTVPPQLLGISVFQDARQPADNSGGVNGAVFNIGDLVPILRRGKIYAAVSCVGSTAMPQLTHTGVNINQSSTIATVRGTLTTDAAALTAGSEIGPAPLGLVSRPPALAVANGLALIEINMPGASN